MAVETTSPDQIAPVLAFALVGALGVGSQWLAWRLRMPAIVLMLAAGLIVGPILGIFDPERDIGVLLGPMISVAVAIILFEGGLTLNRHDLADAATGVRRLVFVGAPLGWALSSAALHYWGGLSWESATVFGGIMIITGPTVIAPLLRTAKLARRPAQLLQWEAIVNDPLGALAAVLAFEVVLVLRTATTVGEAIWVLAIGITVASILGLVGGFGVARAFKRGFVPEFMKVPVLFASLLAVFALADEVLHESGLLAVTVMGIVIANANLASYIELRRFKEHATVLLVSGVFILLAANVDFAMLAQLDWTVGLLIAGIVLVVRPLTVFLALAFSGIPFREKLLVGFTGPRGVVLVAVAGLFGERLVSLGVDDGAVIPPLAFALVAATVVLHGFTLKPFARALGLTGSDVPGILIVGGSAFSRSLAEALQREEIPVLIADPNHGHLWRARTAGIPTFTGDILSEAAERSIELMHYDTILAATDNDAYNTLVTTDLAPEFGRDKVLQIRRDREESARHQLPATLGGRRIGPDLGHGQLCALVGQGWSFRITELTEQFGLSDWRAEVPQAHLFGLISPEGALTPISERDGDKADLPEAKPGTRLLSLRPPDMPEGDEDGEGEADGRAA